MFGPKPPKYNHFDYTDNDFDYTAHGDVHGHAQLWMRIVVRGRQDSNAEGSLSREFVVGRSTSNAKALQRDSWVRSIPGFDCNGGRT
jgi:hypothetical protein